MYHKVRGEVETVVGFILFIIIVIMLIYASIRGYNFSHTQSEITARVLSADIKQIDKDRSVYFISVYDIQTESNEVLVIEDSAVYNQYNSSDLYFELKQNIGATYKFKLFGWRDGRFNRWRTIYAMQKVGPSGK